jgi:hypothetical protein
LSTDVVMTMVIGKWREEEEDDDDNEEEVEQDES